MSRSSLLLVPVLLSLGSVRADPAPEPVDSGPVLAAMRAEIAAKPSRVLIAVEDALTMNEQAACEIVKAAIESTRADNRLVGEIVYTALHHSPAMSAVIVECAVATFPQAVEQIREAMERALGDKAGAGTGGLTEGSGKASSDDTSGKETAESGAEPTGKGGAAEPPRAVVDDFDLTAIGVGGIYLFTPGHSWYRCDPDDPCCTGELSQACLRP